MKIEAADAAPEILLRWEDGENEARRLYVGSLPDAVAFGAYSADRVFGYVLQLPGRGFDLDQRRRLARTSRREVEAFIEGVVTAWMKLATLPEESA